MMIIIHNCLIILKMDRDMRRAAAMAAKLMRSTLSLRSPKGHTEHNDDIELYVKLNDT